MYLMENLYFMYPNKIKHHVCVGIIGRYFLNALDINVNSYGN